MRYPTGSVQHVLMNRAVRLSQRPTVAPGAEGIAVGTPAPALAPAEEQRQSRPEAVPQRRVRRVVPGESEA